MTPGFLPSVSGAVTLVHEPTGVVVASRVELAVSRRARRTGLLGRVAIHPTTAMVLAPCVAIHTAFMQFPIDVLFVDRRGYALRVIHGLQPWRIAVSTRACAAIELAAGVLTRHGVDVGDKVQLRSVPTHAGEAA